MRAADDSTTTTPLLARFRGGRAGLLLLPPVLLFVAFLVLPLGLIALVSLNPSVRGTIVLTDTLTLENFAKFFTTPLYYNSLLTSLRIGLVVVVVDILLGYPLAFVMARTKDRRVFTLLSILVLASMQLDMTVRLYGIVTIFGNNNGLLNQLLGGLGLPGLKLVYNSTGVTLGLVQMTLPFMVFSLVGALMTLSPSYEEAARSLGASRWRAFATVVVPLTLPAVVAGSVIVFALAISSYIVPVILGSSRVPTIATHLYQQISEIGMWQFGGALAMVMLAASLAAILVTFHVSRRFSGGRL